MEEKRPLSTNRMLLSFLIATFLFTCGFLFGYIVSISKYNDISSIQENLKYELLAIEIQKEFLKDSCTNFDPSKISADLTEMRSTMVVLEERFGKTDERVLSQKKIYSILESQHFLFIKEYNEECGKKYDTLLFFYSNLGDYKNRAEALGLMIDKATENNDNLMVYSFDYDLNSELVKTLKERYNIQQRNTVVINEKTILPNVKNVEDIEKYLK